jgi:hypothetical protein
MKTDTHKALCALLQGDYPHETSKQLVVRVAELIGDLRTERDVLRSELETARHPKKITPMYQLVAERDALLAERNALRDVINAELVNTPRYIVHGQVQPCIVLYSDESTTLLRLEDQDMMCSTDTIEWSDELAYRCQELLASAGVVRNTIASRRVLPVLVELVASGALHFDESYYAAEAVEQPEFVAPIGGSDNA